jgi:magnesium-transporting ATPase (P-type)
VHSSNFCLTLDGSTFEALRVHNLPLLEKVAVRAKVFARMAPEDKQRLIEILQRLG